MSLRTSTLTVILKVLTALINLKGFIFNTSSPSENGRMPFDQLG